MAAPRDWRDHLVRVVRCRLSIYASLSISMRLLSFFVSGFVVAFVIILTDAFFWFSITSRVLSRARARARFSISDSDSLAQSFALRVFPHASLYSQALPRRLGRSLRRKHPGHSVLRPPNDERNHLDETGIFSLDASRTRIRRSRRRRRRKRRTRRNEGGRIRREKERRLVFQVKKKKVVPSERE